MIQKGEVECFGDKKVTIFLHNKFVHCGSIKHVGDDCLVIEDVKKGMMTIRFERISEIGEYRAKPQRW